MFFKFLIPVATGISGFWGEDHFRFFKKNKNIISYPEFTPPISAGNNFLDQKLITADHFRIITIADGAGALVFKDIEDLSARPAPAMGREVLYFQPGISKHGVFYRHGITLLNIPGNRRRQGADLKDQGFDSGYIVFPCEIFNGFHNLYDDT